MQLSNTTTPRLLQSRGSNLLYRKKRDGGKRGARAAKARKAVVASNAEVGHRVDTSKPNVNTTE